MGLALLVDLATLIPSPAVARWPAESWDFDIVDFSVSPSTVTEGGSVTLTVFIQNVGSATGTVKVYAGIEKPSGIREYLVPHTIFDIPVGQTRSTTWPYTPSAGSGQYKVDFDVYSPPENHMFDTTGFVPGFTVAGSQNDPTASRSSPSSSSVSLQEGDTQTFVATLSDLDCDLLYAEWYLDGVLKHPDESPIGCTSTTSWTWTFTSTGTFEVTVVVFDSRNDGSHVGRASWFVSVTSGDPGGGGNPGTCSIDPATGILSFSGHEWEIRTGRGGPGATAENPLGNHWSPDNVRCDENGHLVLKITNVGGTWYCAQVTMIGELHFGRYEWRVRGHVDDLDPNVVLGLFNYDGFDERDEIDIELTRWGNPNRPNGNYVVYPNEVGPGFTKSEFEFNLVDNSSTHLFSWQSNRVSFASFEGARPLGNWEFAPPANEDLIPQDAMPVFINLWLVGSNRPINLQEVEVVIESFSWQPEAMPASFQLPPLPPI